MPDQEWERRLAALWATLDDRPEDEFVAAIDALAGELDDDGAGPFERAAARDSTGHSDLAVPLYRQALELGLDDGERRRRAVIQLASSLRNLGETATSLALLE